MKKKIFIAALLGTLCSVAIASMPWRQENDAVFSGYLLPKFATGQALGNSTFKWEGYFNTINGSSVTGLVTSSRQINTTGPLAGGGDLSADRTLSIAQGSSTVDGYIAARFFNYFWGKAESTITITPQAPLTGGGNLQANRTISIPQATNVVDGYLAAADRLAFALKANSTITITPNAPLTGGGDLSANRTISIPQASSTVDGYLNHTDAASLFSKAGSTITITPQAPLTGGGDLSANRTISIPQGSSTVDGYLNHNDAAALFNKTNSTFIVVALTSNHQIDWAKVQGYSDHVFTDTVTTNTVYGFQNISAGQTIKVRLTNTGSFTAAFPTAGSSVVTWIGGTPAVLTTGAHRDIFTFMNDGTSTFALPAQNY